MRQDVIRLVLPAEAEYGRIARIAGSSIALRLGLSYPQVEDLRLAIDEAVILLLRPEGAPGDISILFTIGADELVIDLSSTAGSDQPWVDRGALARFEEIVADTVDEHLVDDTGHRVHLEKRFGGR